MLVVDFVRKEFLECLVSELSCRSVREEGHY